MGEVYPALDTKLERVKGNSSLDQEYETKTEAFKRKSFQRASAVNSKLETRDVTNLDTAIDFHAHLA